MKNMMNSKPAFAILSVCFTLMVTSVQAADLVQFSNGNIADADDVNANFNELETRIETISLTPGPTGADSVVAGPTGPAGADSTVAGPTGPAGADSTVAGPTGPAGADSTVAGPTGPAGLGAVVFNSAPTTGDDVNASYSVGTVWVDTSTNRLYILEDNTANSAVWTIAAAPAVTYALGDTGPAGGIVFYVTAGGLRGLEAAPSDLADATGIRWDIFVDTFTPVGAIADGVGAGDMNTTLIIAETEGDQATYAAGIAANLVISHLGVDYGDWYLPSKFELNLMWLNLADPVGDGRGGGDDSDTLGGFAGVSYWSSSQLQADSAYYQSFANGTQLISFDTSIALVVRAVRAF